MKNKLFGRINEMPEPLLKELNEYAEFLLHKYQNDFQNERIKDESEFREWCRNRDGISDFSKDEI